MNQPQSSVATLWAALFAPLAYVYLHAAFRRQVALPWERQWRPYPLVPPSGPNEGCEEQVVTVEADQGQRGAVTSARRGFGRPIPAVGGRRGGARDPPGRLAARASPPRPGLPGRSHARRSWGRVSRRGQQGSRPHTLHLAAERSSGAGGQATSAAKLGAATHRPGDTSSSGRKGQVRGIDPKTSAWLRRSSNDQCQPTGVPARTRVRAAPWTEEQHEPAN